MGVQIRQIRILADGTVTELDGTQIETGLAKERILAGLKDMGEGRTRPLRDVLADLRLAHEKSRP